MIGVRDIGWCSSYVSLLLLENGFRSHFPGGSEFSTIDYTTVASPILASIRKICLKLCVTSLKLMRSKAAGCFFREIAIRESC